MEIPFKKINLIIIGIGAFLIVLGYLLMATEDFIDAMYFSLSLYVSPILIIAGHVVVVVGILKREKSYVEEQDPTNGSGKQKIQK